MHYRDATKQMADYRQQISQLRPKIRSVQQTFEPQVVEDYQLQPRPVRFVCPNYLVP